MKWDRAITTHRSPKKEPGTELAAMQNNFIWNFEIRINYTIIYGFINDCSKYSDFKVSAGKFFSNLITVLWRHQWFSCNTESFIFHHYSSYFFLSQSFSFFLFCLSLPFPTLFFTNLYPSHSTVFNTSTVLHNIYPISSIGSISFNRSHASCSWMRLKPLRLSGISCQLILLEHCSGTTMNIEVVYSARRVDCWVLCYQVWKAKSRRVVHFHDRKWGVWCYTWAWSRGSTSIVKDRYFNYHPLPFRCACCRDVPYCFQNKETVSHVHYHWGLHSAPSRGEGSKRHVATLLIAPTSLVTLFYFHSIVFVDQLKKYQRSRKFDADATTIPVS